MSECVCVRVNVIDHLFFSNFPCAQTSIHVLVLTNSISTEDVSQHIKYIYRQRLAASNEQTTI